MDDAQEPGEPPGIRNNRRGFFWIPVLFGAGLALGGFLRPAVQSPNPEPSAAADNPDGPIVKVIDREIRNRDFATARDWCESEHADPEDPGIRFRWAVCQEYLNAHHLAGDAYEWLAERTRGELGIHATLGWARCRLAENQLESAHTALARLDHLEPDFDPRVIDERIRLNACLLIAGLGEVKPPDPFDAAVLAWPSVIELRNEHLPWLPPAVLEFDSVPPARHPVAVPGKAMRDVSREQVRDAIVSALHARDHPTLRLALANLDRLDGQRRGPVSAYRRIIDENSDTPEAMMASYNLGLALLGDGAIAAAREAFLGVVDRDPHGTWGDHGRYWIGRTDLESEDTAAALRQFRIVAASPSRRLRAAAGFGWALVRLHDGDADNFERIIAQLEADAVPLSIDTAEFFRVLARYRNRPSALRAEQVGQCLKRADQLKHLGPAGVLIAGGVWNEIGQGARAVELYDSVESRFRGPLSVKIMLASAEGWRMLGRLTEARTRYQAVAAVDPRKLGLVAEMELAEMDLSAGHAEEALRRAYRVWHGNAVASERLLRIMGGGFEKIGQYAVAAECFSGRVPQWN